MSDRLRDIARGKGLLVPLLVFLGASAFVVLVGWLLGVYDHRYDENEETPSAEPRF